MFGFVKTNKNNIIVKAPWTHLLKMHNKLAINIKEIKSKKNNAVIYFIYLMKKSNNNYNNFFNQHNSHEV